MEVIGNVLKFTFNEIKLPANQDDSMNCHGFLQFKIKLNADTQTETQLDNTAHIQFDFENWIATNTVSKVVFDKHPLPKINNINATLYPNPTSGIVNIEIFKLESTDDYTTDPIITKLSVLVILLKYEGINAKEFTVDLTTLNEGVYILKIESNTNSSVFKRVTKVK